MIHDDFGLFDPYKAAKYFGVSVRFKGGGSSPPAPSSAMADTEIKKYGRATLYPMIQSGMQGKGYGTADFNALRSNSLNQGVDEAYAGAKSGFESQMARTLDPKDSRVKNYLANTLQREYVTAKDNMSRTIRQEKVSDIDISMGMAADTLAAEKRMNVSGAQMYNNALQQNMTNQQQAGTFGTNVASGLGSGLMDFYYSQQMGK